MSRQLGTINVPIWDHIPSTGGIAGQLASYNNQIYSWDGVQWIPLIPIFIQSSAPSTTAYQYLWVDTSGGAGDNAKLWVEDGSSYT